MTTRPPAPPERLALLALSLILVAGLATDVDWGAWGQWCEERVRAVRGVDPGLDVRSAARLERRSRPGTGWTGRRIDDLDGPLLTTSPHSQVRRVGRSDVDRHDFVKSTVVSPGRTGASSSRGSFHTFELVIDPAGTPLAAWQCRVEAAASDAGALLVGVENGDAPAYPDPARYDPRALQGDVIVLAAYSLARSLPTEPFVAARLHVWMPDRDDDGNGALTDWIVRVEALADPEGIAIERASVRLRAVESARTNELPD